MAVIKITKDNFKTETGKPGKLLLDFWAEWCGPCRMLSPVVDEIAEERSGALRVGKVNVDEEPELASAFGITSIPTLVLLENGKALKQSSGARSKSALEDWIG